jgi:hypothetical protein
VNEKNDGEWSTRNDEPGYYRNRRSLILFPATHWPALAAYQSDQPTSSPGSWALGLGFLSFSEDSSVAGDWLFFAFGRESSTTQLPDLGLVASWGPR